MQNRYSLLIPETLIPNNSDLNDYTTPGQYYVSTAANSKTIKNCPYTLSGFKLTVEKTSSDGHILQTLKAVNAKYIYYRTAADSNFNDWLTPVTNADFAPLTYNDTSGDNIQDMIKAKAKIIAQNMSGNICGMLPGGWQGQQFGFTLFGKANNIITLMIVLQHDTYTANYNASTDTVSNIKKITTTSVG